MSTEHEPWSASEARETKRSLREALLGSNWLVAIGIEREGIVVTVEPGHASSALEIVRGLGLLDRVRVREQEPVRPRATNVPTAGPEAAPLDRAAVERLRAAARERKGDG